MYLSSYAQKCVINTFDVPLKADIKTVFINDGIKNKFSNKF